MSLLIRILDGNSRNLITKCSSTSGSIKYHQNIVLSCSYSQQTDNVPDDGEIFSIYFFLEKKLSNSIVFCRI